MTHNPGMEEEAEQLVGSGEHFLDTLRYLLEAQQVECPEVFDLRSKPGHPKSCYCHGTGQVEDPRFEKLREVVRERCPRCSGGGGRLRDDWPYLCGRCGSTGFVTRNWAGQFRGALKGVIWEHLPEGWMLSEVRTGKGQFRALALSILGQATSYVSISLNPDEAATEVMIEAINALRS